MIENTEIDKADLFFQHLAVLRAYAKRVFGDGNELTLEEEADKNARASEFRTVGALCDFTERQMVSLVYADIVRPESATTE